ncbi:MAG: hypothetical protein ABIH83_04875 [Candidatus Micrarchaeota archaeon]
MLVRGDGKWKDMPRASYKLVKGQTLEVFLMNYLMSTGVNILIVPIDLAFQFAAMIPCIGYLFSMLRIFLYVWLLNAYNWVYDADVLKYLSKPKNKRGALGSIKRVAFR